MFESVPNGLNFKLHFELWEDLSRFSLPLSTSSRALHTHILLLGQKQSYTFLPPVGLKVFSLHHKVQTWGEQNTCPRSNPVPKLHPPWLTDKWSQNRFWFHIGKLLISTAQCANSPKYMGAKMAKERDSRKEVLIPQRETRRFFVPQIWWML